MTQLFRNIRLAAGVAGAHLSDDPFLLLLQLSRRLPARLVGPLASAVIRLAPGDSAAIPVLLASLVKGNNAEVERRLLLASAATGSPPGASRTWHSPPSCLPWPMISSAARTARRDWTVPAPADSGTTAPSATPSRSWRVTCRASRGQRARLAAELSVLNGAAPVLDRVDYTAVPGRVLHLFTNSLPHTTSGYAQRSHSILAAQQAAGWDVQAVTRLGYPVQVGKIFAKPLDEVDGVRYRRLLSGKLAQQWTHGCSNRPRNCWTSRWSSGPACCTPPRTT